MSGSVVKSRMARALYNPRLTRKITYNLQYICIYVLTKQFRLSHGQKIDLRKRNFLYYAFKRDKHLFFSLSLHTQPN